VPDQYTVAWKAEGQRSHQGPGLDVRGIREDRHVREGHRHEGDVRHHQEADDYPALSRCEAGNEGKWRTSMDGSPRRRPRYSSCKYEVPVLDWKGHSEWIEARGVSYCGGSGI
jgi:hypothetical protein